jgi:hypothetical protein
MRRRAGLALPAVTLGSIGRGRRYGRVGESRPRLCRLVLSPPAIAKLAFVQERIRAQELWIGLSSHQREWRRPCSIAPVSCASGWSVWSEFSPSDLIGFMESVV